MDGWMDGWMDGYTCGVDQNIDEYSVHYFQLSGASRCFYYKVYNFIHRKVANNHKTIAYNNGNYCLCHKICQYNICYNNKQREHV